MANLPELDPIIHGQVRLAVLSILAGAEEAEFTYLRDRTGSTDGNLGAHLLKLEQAGYVEVRKTFVQRRPTTFYRLSDKGREAFVTYVRNLKQILGE